MTPDEKKFWYRFLAWVIVTIALMSVVSSPLIERFQENPKIVRMKTPVYLELNPYTDLFIPQGAEAHMTAVRIDPPETTASLPAPPSAADICNGLTYDFEELENPLICFRAVAAEQGIVHIEAAVPWITDVIGKESGGCPFIIGGDRDIPVGCVPRIHGNGSDTGFGQATHSYWGRGGKLCTVYGVCAAWQILQSPYHSMLYSVVYVAMLDGRYGYCDYEGAPNYHNCGLVSKDWRLT